jgi:hypothetical protein
MAANNPSAAPEIGSESFDIRSAWRVKSAPTVASQQRQYFMLPVD